MSKQSWEGTNDMVPFPRSQGMTRPRSHTIQQHTLRPCGLSNRRHMVWSPMKEQLRSTCCGTTYEEVPEQFSVDDLVA